MTLLAGPAPALDYFVAQGTASSSDPNLYIFAYNTATRTVAFVTNTTRTLPGVYRKLAAGPDGAFWIGADSAGTPDDEGVERFRPNADRTAWSSHFALDVESTAAGGFFHSTVRSPSANLDATRTAAAELSNGRFLVVDGKQTSGRNNAYAFSTVQAAWSGTIVNAGFAAGSGGWLDASCVFSADGQVADVVATVAGSSDRFVVTAFGGNTGIGVYNANNTFRGTLTDIATHTNASAVGTMKTAALGDVALILSAPVAGASGITCQIVGRSVAEADFNTVRIAEFTVASHNTPGVNPRWIEFNDVDGTQSGLIMVSGRARNAAGTDSPAVRFYNTDGTPHSDIIRLNEIVAAIGSGTGTGVTCPAAGLYFATPLPPPGTVVFIR